VFDYACMVAGFGDLVGRMSAGRSKRDFVELVTFQNSCGLFLRVLLAYWYIDGNV
jgi:hypothetical protein